MMLTRSSFLSLTFAAGAAVLVGPRLAKSKEWKTIRVATEGTFPPFNGQAPDGKLIGFEPDLLAELEKRMGVKCELMAQAWDGMMTGLTDGKYDAVMDAITITAKRLEIVDFSQPYTTITSGFVVLKDSALARLAGTGQRIMLQDEAATKAAIAAISPLVKGKTVGVQTASIQDDFLLLDEGGVVRPGSKDGINAFAREVEEGC
jgi:octopine/nopaline transport system substrate-binding protein